jgi:outer membrane PBP1 activator LpoA protein
MIKKLLIIPVLGLMFYACGGSSDTTEVTEEQIEAIEESNQNLDNVNHPKRKWIHCNKKLINY